MIGLVKTHVNKPIKHVELQGLLVNVRHVCRYKGEIFCSLTAIWWGCFLGTDSGIGEASFWKSGNGGLREV